MGSIERTLAGAGCGRTIAVGDAVGDAVGAPAGVNVGVGVPATELRPASKAAPTVAVKLLGGVDVPCGMAVKVAMISS